MMQRQCPFLDPHLTTYHSHISVRNIIVLELGMSITLFRSITMFSGTNHSILQDISHIQSHTIKHMQPPFIFSIVCPYHILQLLSTIWTQ